MEFKAIEQYFPKGDKRRGQALVVNAEAFILGKEEERKRIVDKLMEEVDYFKEDYSGRDIWLIIAKVCGGKE